MLKKIRMLGENDRKTPAEVLFSIGSERKLVVLHFTTAQQLVQINSYFRST